MAILLTFENVERKHKNKRNTKLQSRRWVVERTHSWLNRFGRLLIRWEKKIENYIAMLHLACACITFRATGFRIGSKPFFLNPPPNELRLKGSLMIS